MKHTMPWFKLWSEARNDPKLRALSDAQFRIWFNLLCFAAEQAERGMIDASDMEYLAIEVADGNVDALESTIARLEKFRIITWAEDRHLIFCNFKKRQYDKPSDEPERVAERVRQHRERNKNDGNAHVTPSNADETHGNATKRTEEDLEGEREADQDLVGEGERSSFASPVADAPSPQTDVLPSPPPSQHSRSKKKLEPTDTKPHAVNPYWDALVQGIGHGPPPSMKSAWGRSVKDLKEMGATPEDILARCAVYQVRFPAPDYVLSPWALVKLWYEVAPDTLSQGPPGNHPIQLPKIAQGYQRPSSKQTESNTEPERVAS